MISIAWSFLKSPLGRYLALALAVAIVAGVIAHRLIARGREQGAEQVKGEVQKDNEQAHQLAQAEENAKIADANRRAAQADREAAGFQLDAAKFKARAAALEQQVAGGRAQVAATSDAEMHAYNLRTLRLRTPEDGTPGYNAAEEREIANRITAAPLLEQQVAALKAQDAKRDQYEQAVAQKVQAILEAEQARQAYTAQLEGWYTTLYNLHPPKARKGKCLWLWRCGVDKLALPAPAEIKAKHP